MTSNVPPTKLRWLKSIMGDLTVECLTRAELAKVVKMLDAVIARRRDPIRYSDGLPPHHQPEEEGAPNYQEKFELKTRTQGIAIAANVRHERAAVLELGFTLPEFERMRDAVEAGDLDVARRVVDTLSARTGTPPSEIVKVKSACGGGYTLLYHAVNCVSEGAHDVCDWLLSTGCPVDSRCLSVLPPGERPVADCCRRRNPHALRALLAHGADPNECNPCPRYTMPYLLNQYSDRGLHRKLNRARVEKNEHGNVFLSALAEAYARAGLGESTADADDMEGGTMRDAVECFRLLVGAGFDDVNHASGDGTTLLAHYLTIIHEPDETFLLNHDLLRYLLFESGDRVAGALMIKPVDWSRAMHWNCPPRLRRLFIQAVIDRERVSPGSADVDNHLGLRRSAPRGGSCYRPIGDVQNGYEPMDHVPPTDLPPPAECARCGAATRVDGAPLLRCGSCKRQRYCCAEHQREDWKEHKVTCGRDDSTRSLHPAALSQLGRVVRYRDGATILPDGLAPPECRFNADECARRRLAALCSIRTVVDARSWDTLCATDGALLRAILVRRAGLEPSERLACRCAAAKGDCDSASASARRACACFLAGRPCFSDCRCRRRNPLDGVAFEGRIIALGPCARNHRGKLTRTLAGREGAARARATYPSACRERWGDEIARHVDGVALIDALAECRPACCDDIGEQFFCLCANRMMCARRVRHCLRCGHCTYVRPEDPTSCSHCGGWRTWEPQDGNDNTVIPPDLPSWDPHGETVAAMGYWGN
jgi:hypothetical protein